MDASQSQQVTAAAPEGGMSRGVGNAIFVLCAVFLVSCIAEAGFQAFTRTVPAWLLWVQVGLLTVLVGLGIFDIWRGRFPMSKVERWYQTSFSVLYLVSLYWFMLFANVWPVEKIFYPGLVFLVSNRLVPLLIVRLGQKADRQKT